MNHNQTIKKLTDLRLEAMAQLHGQQQTHQKEGMSADEYLAFLVDHQWESRQHQKIERLMKAASFRQQASLQDVDYSTQRNLNKDMYQRLSTLDFIKRKENVIITGPSGLGKSYLSQAIGHHCCMMGTRVIYYNSNRLFKRLKLAKVDGTYLKELKKMAGTSLIILDDFGLQAMDNHAREALMDIIEDRHGIQSTIVTSQIPVSSWHDIIGEGTIADAILDRLVNSSHRIELKGESLRKQPLE